MHRRRRLWSSLLVAGVLLYTIAAISGPTNSPAPAGSSTRPANWAVKLERPHLSNFYQVTTNLYRGAQPTAQGMAELKAMGIKTIVDLRGYHADAKAATGLGLKQERVPMEPWSVDDAEVVHFLKIAGNTNNYPIFVHCQRGADRTGMMCALYRITVCHWTKEEAIREMTQGGFSFSEAWQNIIDYIRHADIPKLERAAGLATNQP